MASHIWNRGRAADAGRFRAGCSHQQSHRQGHLQPAAAGQHLRHHPAECAEHLLRRLQGQCRPGELSAAAGHHQPRHPAL